MHSKGKTVNEEKLDKHDVLLKKLGNVGKELAELHKTMTDRERVLAGAIVVGSKSPWNNTNVEVYIGDSAVVANLLNDLIGKFNAMKQRIREGMPRPILGPTGPKGDKGEGNGPN